MPQSQLTHPRYRPDIDGLRAVAVLSVVAYHAFPDWMPGGFIGVDVFFVISGYLISCIIFTNLEHGSFSFREFYARRIRRIFPALILTLSACYTVGWFVLFADEYRQLGKHVTASALFVQNLMLWSEAGYFDNSAETKPLLHIWSLGIEEQYYIVWPLLAWLAWKRHIGFLVLTLLLGIASFYLDVSGIRKDAIATFYSPLTRLWELLAGSLLAWCSLHGCRSTPRSAATIPDSRTGRFNGFPGAATLLSSLGLCLLAWGFWHIGEHGFPGAWALVPVTGSLLVILAGPMAWPNRTLLAHPLAIWIGLVSYPLYLWHWPLLSFARILAGTTPDARVRIACVALALLLAWLTLRFIEKPVRRGKQGRVWVTVLTLAMATVSLLGYITYRQEGLAWRMISAGHANSQTFEWPKSRQVSPGCPEMVGSSHLGFCVASPDMNPQVALIGDSHANAIASFFVNHFARNGKGAIMLGKGGCPPFPGVERDQHGCPTVMEDVLRYLENDPAIQEVYLTGRFAAMQSGINFGGTTEKGYYHISLVDSPQVTDRNEIFRAGLDAMLKRLARAGKRVTVILDLPELDFDPRSCLRTGRTDGKRCNISRKVVDERQAAYREIISNLADVYRFRVTDLMDAFCNRETCIVAADEKILYRDSHHLGNNGNAFLEKTGFDLH